MAASPAQAVPDASNAVIIFSWPFDASTGDVRFSWNGFTTPPGEGRIIDYAYQILPVEALADMQLTAAAWEVTDQNFVAVSLAREGEYAFRLKARNDDGLTPFPVVRRFCIDQRPPVTENAVVSLQGGEDCATRLPVVVTWSGFRDQTFCESWPGILGYRIQYLLNDELLPDLSQDLPSFTVQSFIEFPILPEGKMTLLIQAVDRAGQLSAPRWFTFQVDRTRPRLLLAGYAETLLSADDGGTLRMLAIGDDTLNAGFMEIYFEQPGDEPVELGLSLSDRGLQGDTYSRDGLYAGVFDLLPGLATGSYLLSLRYTDACGNEAATWPYLVVE